MKITCKILKERRGEKRQFGKPDVCEVVDSIHVAPVRDQEVPTGALVDIVTNLRVPLKTGDIVTNY